MAGTVIDAMRKRVAARGNNPAMRVKRDGHWQGVTWNEYLEKVMLAGRALVKLGLSPGQGVTIIGYNSPEWVIADVAAIAAGGYPAGIYTTNSPEQCHYIAHHSDAAVAFAEDEAQVNKFREIRPRLPKLRAIVQMLGVPTGDDVLSWDAFLKLGAAVPAEQLEARIRAQKPDDVCTLIYTSGTTGEPKGVMLTHDNLVWTAEALGRSFEFPPGNVTVSYLPMSHVAEQILSIHSPMHNGLEVAFAESLEKLADSLREIRPHFFFGVPRVWEKMQAKISAAGQANPKVRKKIAAWARDVGLRGGYADQRGELRPTAYALADRLVFRTVKEKLGFDRAVIFATSAAPIARDTLEFFLSLGIPICEAYGMSECTGPGSVSNPSKYRTGKAGWVLPGAEMKIASDGEICMRGRHVFKGYFKNPAATAEALDAEGWLHSGDIGELDGEGYVQITDRKKDLLITAGGENIAPQLLEGYLKSVPVIAQAVVVGDRKKYLGALVTLDPEKVADEARAAGSPAGDVKAAAGCPVFRAHLERQVEAINAKLARVQTIKKFSIIPHEFTIDGGELTPTMKIKRKVINTKYKDEIDRLYAEP